MNLTSIFRKDSAIREANLVDHGWMTEGLVHPGEPQLDLSQVKNPNNVKPQLEVEWGLGGPDVSIDEPAGAVQRNIPEDAEGDAGNVVMFARDMMNRGFGAAKVASALKRRYGKTALSRARADLTDLFRMDGIIGRVAVDGRGYGSCKEALKAASRSPYKRFIGCVVGCECGDPCMMPPGGAGGPVDEDSTGNPMDDFLASKKTASAALVAHCRSTMLPVVATVGDLDPSELDSMFVEVMNVTGVPQAVRDELAAAKGTAADRLAAAFRWLDRSAARKEKAQYEGDVVEDRFVMAPPEIELADMALPDIEVEEAFSQVVVPDTDGGLMEEMDLAPLVEPEFEGVDEVVLEEPVEEPEELGVEMMPRPDDEELFFAGDKK